MKEKKFIMNYSPMKGVQSHNEPRERHLKPPENDLQAPIQLVQLPTSSNIPGVSMVRNTGDSEDHWNCRTNNRIRVM